MQVFAAAIALMGIVVVAWSATDYRKWLALGPGGIPHNFAGWIKVTALRLQKREPLGTAVYAKYAADSDNVAILTSIMNRVGERPKIAPYPIPHRQLTEHGGIDQRLLLKELFDSYIESHSTQVVYQKSFFERRHDAIFLRDPDRGHSHARGTHGEIAHLHPGDGSMHMIFSPRDAKTIIEAGWGERHPLAGRYPGMPDTYLMIYSPRNTDDLAAIKALLKAAVNHMRAAQSE